MIDERLAEYHPYPEGGSVSWGTMRLQDIMPAIIEAAERVMEAVAPHMDCAVDMQDLGRMDTEIGEVKDRVEAATEEGDDAPYWQSEDCLFDWAEILDWHMQELSPPGYSWGTHEGDGSDIGWWLYEEDDDER